MSRIDSNAGRHGELKLAFAQQNDRTVMAESFFRVPLQVMKPRYDESGCACVYLLSPTGGVVQGDDYQIEVTLAPNTHATLTTQASTKVYAMPRQGATQFMRVRVGQDAIFEYLPDSTILFRDANFSQEYLPLFGVWCEGCLAGDCYAGATRAGRNVGIFAISESH